MYVVNVLTAIISAILLGIGGLLQFNIVKPPNWLTVPLVTAVAAGALFEGWRAARHASKEPTRQGALADVATSVMGTVNAISNDQNLKHGVVGGNVFVARKQFAIRRRWPFVGRTTVLIRPPIWRIRYADGPQASMVEWTTDKGAVGAAYEARSAVYKDWSPIAKRYGRSNHLSRAQFDSLGEEEKSGFTYEEFLGIAAKYAEVLAVPIMSVDGGRVLGVISIDRPFKEDEEDSMQAFDTQSVEETVNGAAMAISSAIEDALQLR
ncbi:hypothetical protein RE0356_14380 [Prescottella equi]|nr:hypothetical protein RE0356_14380 [Prescottella equi]